MSRHEHDTNNQIYGIHPIMEALISGKSVDKLFMQNDLKSEQFTEMKLLARKLGVSVIKAPKEKLNKLCRKNHQGVVAFTSPIEFANIEEIVQRVYERSEVPLFLMLDKVNDVRNFGSIARSALSAGCHAVIIPHKGSAAINEESIKTSAGALYHIPVCKVLSLGDTIKMLKASGIPTVACSEKAKETIYTTDMERPVNLLFGNEGEGIEPHLIKMAGEEAQIPMRGNVGSLNVAVACGVALYEAVRQRIQAG
ncbi:MAG: 23S rRNA (guanosine(2251)-2'-O)-methyltransferase RlmB [Cryomorphaceae bacterium]